MKLIELTTTAKAVWTIPAHIVCGNRASYYSKEGPGVKEEEFTFCMENDDEIIDWAKNNMNWEDVSHEARLVEDVEEDMNREWGAGDMEVIEQPSSSG